ncbi:MAG: helix-turn-helix transcriptional regulator [Candidatus Hydrogenedentes bacterium]|nr:helix-turn-helix transcriptional regulator [Candidatus Hydrogenedentota bacterium]
MPEKNRIGAKMRQVRETHGLSRAELAAKCASDERLIEQIEAGELVPSLTPLLKIARALGVRLGTFLDDAVHTGPVLVRSGQSTNVTRFSGDAPTSHGSTLDFFSLAADKADRHMEPFVIDVRPSGAAAPPQLSSHEGEEFIYVLAGQIEVCYGKERHTLEAGDSIYYDSIVPHHVHAAGDGDAKILAVVYAPY